MLTSRGAKRQAAAMVIKCLLSCACLCVCVCVCAWPKANGSRCCQKLDYFVRENCEKIENLNDFVDQVNSKPAESETASRRANLQVGVKSSVLPNNKAHIAAAVAVLPARRSTPLNLA